MAAPRERLLLSVSGHWIRERVMDSHGPSRRIMYHSSYASGHSNSQFAKAANQRVVAWGSCSTVGSCDLENTKGYDRAR